MAFTRCSYTKREANSMFGQTILSLAASFSESVLFVGRLLVLQAAYNSTTVPPIAQVITEPNTKSYLASEMQASACCSDD